MYVICFIGALITPLALFAVGLYWKLRPPKFTDEGGLAYRTELSARSQETWEFAHVHISNTWVRLGVILTVLASVLMVIFADHYASFILWLIGGEMVFLCISVFLVDTALKNGFDEDGHKLP